MDPRHLIQLAVILDKGSVTAATQHLLLTQPTLTRNMGILEMQAGTQLFHRSRLGVKSTPLGENLARMGRAIDRQLQAAQEAVSRHKIGLRTHLRVGVSPLVGMALMPELSDVFLSDNDHISLSITTGRPQSIVEQFIDGNLDLVLAPAAHTINTHIADRELICSDEISIFCSPNHPLATSGNATVGQLSDCDWINVGTTTPFQNSELELLNRSGIQRLRTRFTTVSDAVILLQVLMKGKHLAVLPRKPLQLMRDQYPLVELTPPGGVSRRELFLWCQPTVTEDPVVMELKSTLKQLLN